MNLLDLEFLATGCEPYRYPLEKMVMGENKGFANKKGSMHTLLNVSKMLPFFKQKGESACAAAPISCMFVSR
jgi:hypothetical protein